MYNYIIYVFSGCYKHTFSSVLFCMLNVRALMRRGLCYVYKCTLCQLQKMFQ